MSDLRCVGVIECGNSSVWELLCISVAKCGIRYKLGLRSVGVECVKLAFSGSCRVWAL